MRNLMEKNKKNATVVVTPMVNCNVKIGKRKFLETPIMMLMQIELLVIFTAILLLFLVTLGWWRRRCNSEKFQVVIFTAYTLSTSVLTYALGLMHDFPLRNELFPVWAMFLMITLGSADSVSAYSLEDNERWKTYNWQFILKLIWLALLIDLYFPDRSDSVAAATCLFIVLAMKSDERARAMMAGSRHSLERSAKVVADYMSGEHKNGGASCGEVDPFGMRGYTYLVRGEERRMDYIVIAQRFIGRCVGNKQPAPAPAPDYRKSLDKDKLITVEKVWNCEGTLLSVEGKPSNEMKDICLSFALFKLLRLRYAGYSLPPKAHEDAWKLIRNGLFSQEDGYKRAFHVIEIELMYLFDFFYTKYSIIFQPGWGLIKLMECMYVVMGIWATTSLLKHHKRIASICQLATMPNGLSVDILGTSVMIILFIAAELMQFFFICFSEWAKVILICKYVQKKSWQENRWVERMIRAICRVQLQKPWEQKLHQYSFLESYLHKPSRLLNNMIMAAYIDQHRDGQVQSKPIPLPEELKQAVFHALKLNYNTKLEIGQALRRVSNESKKLLWACQLETQTQVILVWHIATSFCEYQQPVESDSPETRKNFRVATNLSKYLAYLVAFAPNLLLDRPCITEYVFDQAIIEAKLFFRGSKEMKKMVEEMEKNDIGRYMNKEAVIERGARLGKELVNHIKDREMIWKTLADFWVELVMYVATSDNVKAHIEHLARGGEFVTHLWAVLSHTGIERKPPTKPCNAHKRSNSY
ncbi:hypothetical protein ACJRO7_017568 [Eucalyptus globulus]|uniref:DUF4220 domain-containing protein n=1 Tax=Eucalyptus globulus TaxID=34317 RepID=A0ABD3KRU2_EUCGL